MRWHDDNKESANGLAAVSGTGPKGNNDTGCTPAGGKLDTRWTPLGASSRQGQRLQTAPQSLSAAQLYALSVPNALLGGGNDRVAVQNARNPLLLSYQDEEPKARKRTGPKARGKTEATNRAVRGYLEDGLGWLKGYPAAEAVVDGMAAPAEGEGLTMHWRTASKGSSWRGLEVNRELLRTSFYTLRGAHRKFPHALERVVGDVQAWSDRQEARLREVQRVIHDGERLLGSPPAPSTGVDLRVELEWLAWGDAGEQARMQEALRRWGAALAQVASSLGAPKARRLALEVLTTRQDLSALERLRPLLSSAMAYSVVTHAGAATDTISSLAKRNLLKGDSPPDASAIAPSTRVRPIGAQVVDFLLAESDPQARGLVLACVCPIRCEEWESWWAAAELCRKHAEKLKGLLAQSSKQSSKKSPHAAALAALVREAALEASARQPRGICIESLHQTVRPGLQRLPASTVPKVLRCLAQVPDAGCSPLVATEEILQSALRHLFDASERRRADLIDGLADRLDSSAGLAMTPDQRLCFAHVVMQDLIEFEWSAHDVPWERRDTVLDAALLICSADVPDEWTKEFVTSYRIGAAFEGYAAEVQDPARLAALVLQRSEDVTWNIATVAARFACERDPSATGTVAVLPFTALRDTLGDADAWNAWSAANQRDNRGVTELAKISRSGVLRKELRQAAAAAVPPHELTRFAALYARAKVNAAPSAASPPDPLPLGEDAWAALCAWIPEPLHAATARFLAHGPSSGLAKAFGPALVDPGDIVEEHAAIEARLQSSELAATKRSALELRRDSLSQRLDRSLTLESSEVARLQERLHARAVRARFRRWLTKLQDAVLAQLPLGAQAAIDLATDRQADLVISGLSSLPNSVRDLSYRLLHARSGDKPWDLRDDPANAEWCARAAEHGLNLSRWFSDAEFEVAPPSEGAALRFALEDDPLEVMKMGLWFDTCLSPGDINYFSTVANAADANKRLLVGRDENGTAQARCLFAITEQWHLLGFHVYAHENRQWAEQTITGILQTVSDAVGAGIAPRGKVATLVATKWYDDGPHDLTSQLETLGPNGELTKRLESAPPASAFDLVTESLSAPLVEVALELILRSPVIQQSGARIASFAPLLTTCRLPRHFALNLIFQLALAEESAPGEPGVKELALAMIDRLCKGKSPARLNLDVHEAISLAQTLRRLGQSGQVLQVLRKQRDPYEANRVQRETALAFAAMGRSEAAARIWRSLHQAGDAEATAHLKSTGNLP